MLGRNLPTEIEVLLFGGLRAFAPSIILETATLGVSAQRPSVTAADIKRAVTSRLATAGGDDAAAWVESSRLATESRILADDERVALAHGMSLALLPPVNGG